MCDLGFLKVKYETDEEVDAFAARFASMSPVFFFPYQCLITLSTTEILLYITLRNLLSVERMSFLTMCG